MPTCQGTGRRLTVLICAVRRGDEPFTRLPWLIAGSLQRRQLRRLVRRADASVTPVQAWQEVLDPPSLASTGRLDTGDGW